jgi:hemerythrin-like metal-binding protein
MNLEWQPEYSVGVEEIDDQHKEFVRMMNEFETSLSLGYTDNLVYQVLDRLEAYAIHHFATEEMYFAKFRYDNTQEHINEHTFLLDHIKNLKAKHVVDEIKLGRELIDFLQDWLINHIISSDKQYTKCFHENGLR